MNSFDRLENLIKNLDSAKIGFGKYKNKTLWDVSQEDPKYLEWLVENVEDSASIIAIAFYLENISH